MDAFNGITIADALVLFFMALGVLVMLQIIRVGTAFLMIAGTPAGPENGGAGLPTVPQGVRPQPGRNRGQLKTQLSGSRGGTECRLTGGRTARLLI